MLTEVKERPILFSGPMVTAILDGRKTQTRRIAKEFVDNELSTAMAKRWPQQKGCRYGEPGERLWVREAFCTDFKPMIYRASATSDTYGGEQIKYKPSIHMPRWASRITLEITGVRVERLQAISESDAIAEGCIKLPASGRITDTKGGQYGGRIWTTARAWYAELWNQINGPLSWAENPLVWVVEFRKV